MEWNRLLNWVVDGDDNRQQQKLYEQKVFSRSFSPSLSLSLSNVAEVCSVVFVVAAIYRCFCCCYYWIIIISILFSIFVPLALSLSLSHCLFYSCVLFNAEETQQWHRRAARSQINTALRAHEKSHKRTPNEEKRENIYCRAGERRAGQYEYEWMHCGFDSVPVFLMRSHSLENDKRRIKFKCFARCWCCFISFYGRAIVCSSLTWYYTLEKSLDSNLSSFGLCVRVFFVLSLHSLSRLVAVVVVAAVLLPFGKHSLYHSPWHT